VGGRTWPGGRPDRRLPGAFGSVFAAMTELALTGMRNCRQRHCEAGEAGA
jgi:hypothetical protein